MRKHTPNMQKQHTASSQKVLAVHKNDTQPICKTRANHSHQIQKHTQQIHRKMLLNVFKNDTQPHTQMQKNTYSKFINQVLETTQTTIHTHQQTHKNTHHMQETHTTSSQN